MSAGVFSRTIYTTDEGNKVPIRVQPETLSLTIGSTANASDTGTADVGWPSASIGKGKNQNGIHARFITVYIATPPTGYKPASVYRIPVLKKSVWDTATKGGTATYLGVSGTIISKTSERIV